MSAWPQTLTLLGAGKMGQAMLQGWLAAGLDPRRVTIIEPTPSAELIALCQAKGISLGAPVGPSEMLVLAVKPQTFAVAAGPALADGRTLVVSIMAGKTIANIRERLPHADAIVRAMPNTPAAVGRGVAGAVAEKALSATQKSWTENLFKAVGAFHWLDAESQIDAVTAISGSGPAYVFALVEAMARAGVALGLSPETAEGLARATVEGSGELLHREPGTSAATLRQNVTSPGGTTAAALAVLQGADGLDALMARACAAAAKRAGELAG